MKTELETEKARAAAETSVALPLLSSTPVPFDKQVPSSLYSSYKNLTSFEHLTTKQELLSLISRVAQQLIPSPSRAHRLEKDLLQSYDKCLQTETRVCNTVWSECLLAISSAVSSRRAHNSTASIGDSDLISIQKELEALVSEYIDTVGGTSKSQSEIISSVVKLSQQFRILVKKLSGDHLLQVMELFWKTAVLLYDRMQQTCNALITQNCEEIKTQIQREETRIHSQMRVFAHQWEARMTETTQENGLLKAQLGRLRRDIEHCMEMVTDRDEELQQLRDSGMYSELEKVLAEFVANAGDDPGDPELPKSLYGSSAVKGVKMNPTRFGGQPKPEPVLVEKPKIDPVPVQSSQPQVGFHVDSPAIVSESESEDSVSSATLNQIRMRTANKRDSIRDSNSSYLRPVITVQNIILYQLSRHPHAGHILKAKEIHKLFESIMDAKFKLDHFDENQDAPPRSLTDFTLDFLYLINEKKSLTLKHAASLVKSIEKLRSDGDKYCDLLHKLLELSDPGTCPVDLGLFLVKVRMAFQDIMLRGKAKPSKSDMEVGGKVTFAEAADLVLAVFREERDVGEAVMERIKLPEGEDIEKIRLIFCGRLAKIGRDLKYFWVQADSQKMGSIGFPVFARICRISLEMNLSQTNTESLWASLTNSESLTYSQLTSLDFKAFSTRAYSKSLSISKLTFLTAIIDQYWAMRTQDLDRLHQIFLQYDTNGDGVLTLKEFGELINSLEEGTPPSVTVQMFREALEIDDNASNPDAMSSQSFCEVVLKHQLGGLGKNVFQSRLRHLFQKTEEAPKTPHEKVKRKKAKGSKAKS